MSLVSIGASRQLGHPMGSCSADS